MMKLDPYLGTCQETVKGGNHFRYWTQNGKDANTCVLAGSAHISIDALKVAQYSWQLPPSSLQQTTTT